MKDGIEKLKLLDPEFEQKFKDNLSALAEDLEKKVWQQTRGKGNGRELMKNIRSTVANGLNQTYTNEISSFISDSILPIVDDLKFKTLSPELKKELSTSVLGCSLYCGAVMSGFDRDNEQLLARVLDELKSDKYLQTVIRDLNNEMSKETPSLEAIQKIASSPKYLLNSKVLDKISGIEVTSEIRTQMENEYSHDDEKPKGLERFKFVAAKTAGVEPGVIAKKKPISEPKQDSKKYEYQWMIKKQSTRENIADVMAADIARYFLGDNAPKDRLLKNKSSDSSKSFIASRFIEGFQTLNEVYPDIDPRTADGKLELYKKAYKDIPGMYDVAAVNLLIGNYDFHLENTGQVTKDKNGIPTKEAATIDFGKALNFNLVHSDLSFICNTKMQSDEKPEVGKPLSPQDLLRALHGEPYEFKSPIFLNDEFAKALDRTYEKFTSNPDHLESIVANTANGIKKSLSEEQMFGIYEQISPDANYENFADEMVKVVKERMNMMKELSLDIKTQIALKENDTQALDTLLKENPSLITKTFKWLPETNDPKIPKSSSISEYVKDNSCSKDISNIVNKHLKEHAIDKIRGNKSERNILGRYTQNLAQDTKINLQPGIQVH